MDVITNSRCCSLSRLMIPLVLALLAASRIRSQQLCEHCNCQISTTREEAHAVYNMGLICNSGTITWFGASGGVILELTPFIHGSFRACFVSQSDENTHVKISQESSHISKQRNYKLKQEPVVSRKLNHLLTSSKRSREYCVDSKTREPIQLYIEAVRTPGTGGVSKVIFHYDMEKIDTSVSLSSMNECRPCTTRELLDAYCSMDFVVIGSMSDVRDNEQTGKTEITMAVKQIVHQTQPTFFRRLDRSHPHLTGTVVVPRKCGIQKDHGDFLLSGRVRFGYLALKCAPYLHEWRQIQHDVECSHD